MNTALLWLGTAVFFWAVGLLTADRARAISGNAGRVKQAEADERAGGFAKW